MPIVFIFYFILFSHWKEDYILFLKQSRTQQAEDCVSCFDGTWRYAAAASDAVAAGAVAVPAASGAAAADVAVTTGATAVYLLIIKT